jgi:hypothetical protein
MLSSSVVTIVAMQDGVGARSVPTTELPTRVTPYLAAMHRACSANGVEMWRTEPAPFARLEQQITTARAVTPNLVTYEYSSFWMGSGPGGTLAQTLHDDYAAWLATQ